MIFVPSTNIFKSLLDQFFFLGPDPLYSSPPVELFNYVDLGCVQHFACLVGRHK